MNNEKGFVLPLTLIIVFLVTAYTIHELMTLQTEMRFFKQQEELFTIESLVQMAAYDMVAHLRHDESVGSGQFQYEHGFATYKIEKHEGETLYIQLIVQTNSNGRRIVRLFYNVEDNMVTAWWEVTRQ
ncbi:competence type IV pilus minor pilin ComGG [Bacillus alkalicellulosilyticus]|uniref:competence type IV pilus minor pilin ComGG n=1 Tax=Alkalihalobacterium alkalicellulosilyticum TaxID=1912214 RepID=UPI001482E540|nr:competence type IV pilus minor pilin ComGG [Bacillus alkalicellulosilyticus]